MKVNRNIVLVNKLCVLLKEECLVFECWWVEKNKGMFKNEDGDWVMFIFDDEDMFMVEFD